MLEGDGDLTEDQQEIASISINGGQTLLGMINNLLDISKLEAGLLKLDYQDLVVEDLLASAAVQVASLAANKSLSFTSEIAPGLPGFSGDEDKMRRTLVNLMANAIKFTPRGGMVNTDVRLTSDGSGLLFTVKDSGEGIPKEAFGHIFEKFGQVESGRPGREKSTGLGLAFCKMAAEAHGGQIWVESTVGEGSIFSLTIPIRQPRF